LEGEIKSRRKIKNNDHWWSNAPIKKWNYGNTYLPL